MLTKRYHLCHALEPMEKYAELSGEFEKHRNKWILLWYSFYPGFLTCVWLQAANTFLLIVREFRTLHPWNKSNSKLYSTNILLSILGFLCFVDSNYQVLVSYSLHLYVKVLSQTCGIFRTRYGIEFGPRPDSEIKRNRYTLDSPKMVVLNVRTKLGLTGIIWRGYPGNSAIV